MNYFEDRNNFIGHVMLPGMATRKDEVTPCCIHLFREYAYIATRREFHSIDLFPEDYGIVGYLGGEAYALDQGDEILIHLPKHPNPNIRFPVAITIEYTNLSGDRVTTEILVDSDMGWDWPIPADMLRDETDANQCYVLIGKHKYSPRVLPSGNTYLLHAGKREDME